MTDESLRKKWDEIYQDASVGRAAAVLAENAHLLPPSGLGLDLACGMGGNALFMVQAGLDVHAWDVSAVAVDKLQRFADEHKLALFPAVRNVTADPPEPGRFDVIAVSHFLDRQLMPRLLNALKPGGLLFYQTFTRARVDDSGPRNAEFRLADGELLQLCGGLKLLVYREEGTVGDTNRGFRNEAMLVAQKQP